MLKSFALPRGQRRPSYFNHLAKSGTPDRSTQSLGFLPPVSHWGAPFYTPRVLRHGCSYALALGQRLGCAARSNRPLARFPPQTAKRWPDYCHNPRNQNLCGEIRLKQACGRHSLGRWFFKLLTISRGMDMIEAAAIGLATVAMGIPAMIMATALGSRLGFYW